MRDLFTEMQKKKRAILLAALFLGVYNVLRLIVILLSPFTLSQVINLDVGGSLGEYLAAWQAFIAEGAYRQAMVAETLQSVLLCYGGLAAAYVTVSPMLARRRNYARYLVTGLVVVELVLDIVLGVHYGLLPTKISLLTAIFFLLFLSSPAIAREFR